MQERDAGVMIVDGRSVPFTHPDKALFGAGGITKAELAAHYLRAWPRMAPLLKDRPVTIKRYPRGLGGGGFYQRRAQEWFPSWVRTASVPMKEHPETILREVVIDTPATAVFLVNIGALEIHASLARAQAPDIADRMIFDLDPPRDFTDEVRRLAADFHDMLRELRLPAFVKTTGSRGFHIVVPLKPQFSFDVTRRLARALAERMIARAPEHLTLNARKAGRKGRVLIDIWRNAHAQTAVAAWSTRARAQATVAVPLRRAELIRGLHPRQWTLANIAGRLKAPDPWAELPEAAVDLKAWAQAMPEPLRVPLREKGPA